MSMFRKPSGYANGNTRDRRDACSPANMAGAGSRAPSTTGGSVTLMDRFEGKRLNSPNDIVCKSDRSIWFTDPSFGILGWYEGAKAGNPSCRPMSTASTPRARPRSSPKASTSPTAWRSRPTNPFCISSSRARCRGRLWLLMSQNKTWTTDAPSSMPARRDAGRFPRRHRRQPLVRLGHGRGGPRRCARLQSGGKTDRPHRPARALRQSLLRRRAPQPPVHGGEHLALRPLRQHTGHPYC